MIIDLSKYNRVSDWKAVSQHVDGAILRVGYRGYGSGKIVIDPMFDTFAKACNNYGIPIGLYFMSQAITIIEAVEEADFALNYAEKYNVALPIYIDSEDGDGTAKIVRADALSKLDRTDICSFFCQTIENSRFRPGVYASTAWFKEKLDVTKLERYNLWVAQYGPQCTAKHRVDMWQYTSNGSVPGIIGRVDCSTLMDKPVPRLLKKGAVGEDVKELQVRLNTRYGFNLTVDGKFGSKTETAVKEMQKANNLIVDGIVGERTRAVL